MYANWGLKHNIQFAQLVPVEIKSETNVFPDQRLISELVNWLPLQWILSGFNESSDWGGIRETLQRLNSESDESLINQTSNNCFGNVCGLIYLQDEPSIRPKQLCLEA